MKRSKGCWLGGCLWVIVTAASAQECALPTAASPDHDCNWIPSGTLFQDPAHPFLQSLTIFARFHYQYAWIDGEAAGRDFWYASRGEIRRFWPGLRATLADGALTLHHEMMLEDDQRPRGGDRDLSYLANWACYAEWQLDKTFPGIGGGSWWVGYGKRCLPLAEEVLDSSKFLPVVERSAVSNRALITTSQGSAPLGVWLRHQTGRWESFAGLYSTDTAAYWGNWDDGTAWILQIQRDISALTGSDSALAALAFYSNHTDARDDALSGNLNWMASAWTIIEEGPWTFRGNVLFGEADAANPRRDGRVWGAVGTVERWLIEDRLEIVGRYHYQGSRQPQAITPYSRYIPVAVSQEVTPTPAIRGDEQHGLYLGLNWLPCGHQLKFMGGVEWDLIRSDSKRVYDGVTYWLGTRCYF